MGESILNSIKKILGLSADDTSFDADILIHINSVFSTLTQLGIGPVGGFMIEDATPTWGDFLVTTDPVTLVSAVDPSLNHIKTYIFLRVRLLFDPPTTSFHLASMKEQVQELEWRINTQRESRYTFVSEDLDAPDYEFLYEQVTE